MANTPLYLPWDKDAASTGILVGRIRDVEDLSVVEASINLTEVAPRLWGGTITQPLTGDKYIDLTEDGAEAPLSLSPSRFIHNLEDTTDAHFCSPTPPVPLYANVIEVGGIAVQLEDVAIAVPSLAGIGNRGDGSSQVKVFIGETVEVQFTVLDLAGNPIDLQGKSLNWIVSTLPPAGTEVATVTDANMSVTGADNNVVTLSVPSAVTASRRTLRWALRDDDSPFTVYGTGTIDVRYAPHAS